MNRAPALTIGVLLVTGVFTTLQFFYPPILFALRRTPGVFSQHEWWRFITPILVHDGGWRQIAFNFPATAMLLRKLRFRPCSQRSSGGLRAAVALQASAFPYSTSRRLHAFSACGSL